MAVICRLGHFVLCPFLRTTPAFSTILPFYLVVDLSFFHAQQPAFRHQKPRLKVPFCPYSAPIFNPNRTFLPLHTMYINTYRLAFWCKMPCVLMQNALRFGANCTAFWCKIHCVLVLNAVYLAANRSFCASNGTTICIICTFMQNKMAAPVFITHPLFAPNKPSRESFFSGRRAVGRQKRHS